MMAILNYHYSIHRNKDKTAEAYGHSISRSIFIFLKGTCKTHYPQMKFSRILFLGERPPLRLTVHPTRLPPPDIKAAALVPR